MKNGNHLSAPGGLSRIPTLPFSTAALATVVLTTLALSTVALSTSALLTPAAANPRTILRQAVQSNSSSKTLESLERAWNPLAGRPGLNAEVAETEPNDDILSANPFACGDDLRPARIDFPDDIDYLVFTANAGDRLTIGTNADGATGQIDDSIVGLFDASGTLLEVDDDSGPGLYSLLSDIPAPYTGTYYLGILGWDPLATGAYRAFLRCVPAPPPPVNDTCAGALGLPCTTISISGTTTGASDDYTPALPNSGGCTGFSALGADIVYSVTLGDGGSLALTYTSQADASIYLLDACVSPGDAACVAGADNTLTGDPEVLNFTNSTGSTKTYYLILDTFGTGTSGLFTLTGMVSCPPVPVEGTSWSSLKARFAN